MYKMSVIPISKLLEMSIKYNSSENISKNVEICTITKGPKIILVNNSKVVNPIPLEIISNAPKSSHKTKETKVLDEKLVEKNRIVSLRHKIDLSRGNANAANGFYGIADIKNFLAVFDVKPIKGQTSKSAMIDLLLETIDNFNSKSKTSTIAQTIENVPINTIINDLSDRFADLGFFSNDILNPEERYEGINEEEELEFV